MLLWCWCALFARAEAEEGSEVWVVEGDPAERPLKRVVRRLGRRADIALQPLTADRWCVTFADPPPSDLHRRATRWLRQELEVRMDCTVAAYPLGRGWLAYVVQPPATGLEDALPELVEELSLYQRVLHRPSDETQPSRLCVSALGIADPHTVSEALGERGLQVSAIYEVGGCVRL